MISIVSKDPTPVTYYSNGTPTYRYTFSDGTTKVLDDADAKDWVDTQNKLEKYRGNTSKGVPPTKIDVVTGAGVPGGFDAASIKTPSMATANIGFTISSITSMAGSLGGILAAVKSGTIPSVPGISPPGLSTATAKLDGLKSKAMDKLKAAAKAPDFTKRYKLPSPPSLPSMPDFKSMGIPSMLSLPNVSLPSVPSVPKVPSIGGF